MTLPLAPALPLVMYGAVFVRPTAEVGSDFDGGPSPGRRVGPLIRTGTGPDRSRRHAVGRFSPVEVQLHPTMTPASFTPRARPEMQDAPASVGRATPVVCQACVPGSRHQYNAAPLFRPPTIKL